MNPTIPLRIHVEPDRLTAAPTEPVSLELSVFNTSDIIDGFDVTVVGADQTWVQTEPDWISLFPDSEGSVNVKVTLPSDFPAGPHDLGVKVTSRTTNEVFAVGGVTLDVTERRLARIDVEPDSVVGGKKGRFAVVLFNDGNVPIDVGIETDDDGKVLSYEMIPPRIQLGPGQSRTCQLVVTAPRPITGSPAVRPFVVTAIGPGVELTAPATFTSRPWIPRWLLTFLAIAMLLGLWAFIVGLAIDAIIDDSNQDLAKAFEDGIASVVAAVAPGAGGGAEAGDVISGPAGTVPGLVTAASDGTPVAGATVQAAPLISAGSQEGEPDTTRDPIEVPSGDDGTFAFEEMVRGSYAMTVASPGYVTSEPVTVEIPYEGDPLLVELVGGPGLVSGVVLADGEPLQNATVLVRRLDPATGNAVDPTGTITEEPLRSVITPVSGRFAIDELETPATYELDISSPGFTTMRVISDLTPGQRLVGLEIELAPGGAGSLTGGVTDAVSGAALGGVAIVATGDGIALSTTTLTAASADGGVGSYRLGGLPIGEYTATFSLEGYDDVALPVTVTGEAPDVTLNPAMSPASGAPIASVSGTVTQAGTGARLGGVSIAVAGDGGQFTTSSLTQASDGLEVGSFRLTGLPTGSYTATFTLANHEPAALPFTVTAEDADATLAPVMALAANAPIGTISGQVNDEATGVGLGGVTVTVTGEGIELTTVTFTGDGGTVGSFVLNAIPIGTFTATFATPTHQTVAVPFTVTADDPQETLTATLTAVPTTVSGSVVEVLMGEGPFTQPVAGIAVRYAGEVVGTSDIEGDFSVVINAPAGPATLRFTADGYRTTVEEIAVAPGSPIDVGTVSIFRLGSATGNLIDQFGRLIDGPGNVTFTVVDVEEFGGLPDIDPASIPPQSLPIAESITIEDLPGPAEYEIRADVGSGPTPFRGLYTRTASFRVFVSGESSFGGLALPYAPRVVWGTVSCFGYPYTFPVGLTTGLTGGPPTRVATPDGQGRVAFTQAPADTYLLGVVGEDEGGNPWVYPTGEGGFIVTVPGTDMPVFPNSFCVGDAS